MKRLISLLLSLLLFSACLPALAAGRSFPDLPETHWAYANMTRAADLGIISGRDDGAIAPDAVLTWGEFSTMLARCFYPAALAAQSADAAHWALPAYRAALSVGVVQEMDFLPVSPSGLDGPLTRQDAAVLLDRVIRVVCGLDSAVPSSEDMSATDWNTLPEPYRAGVLQCYARGLLMGYPNGTFGGADSLTRASGAVVLLRCRDLPGVQAAAPETPPAEPSAVTPPVETAPPATIPADSDLTALGCNDAKLVRLYGTADQTRYPSATEAAAHMAAITVPVWTLNGDGSKSPSTLSLKVHAAIADEVVAIFTEIYNDPEQFPIKNAGGYDWRGDSAKGEHNCGTAIDINYEENYQIYASGSVGAGSCWEPGVNPYSIPENGSVVRIFNAHGFSWGGNAWPTNKDYMHFSYLGV